MRVKFKDETDRLNFLKSQYKGRITSQKVFYGVEFQEVGVSFVKVSLDEHHSKFEFFNRERLIDVQDEQLKEAKSRLISSYLS